MFQLVDTWQAMDKIKHNVLALSSAPLVFIKIKCVSSYCKLWLITFILNLLKRYWLGIFYLHVRPKRKYRWTALHENTHLISGSFWNVKSKQRHISILFIYSGLIYRFDDDDADTQLSCVSVAFVFFHNLTFCMYQLTNTKLICSIFSCLCTTYLYKECNC